MRRQEGIEVKQVLHKRETKRRGHRVNHPVDYPGIEKQILEFWDTNRIFQKSIDSRPGDSDQATLDQTTKIGIIALLICKSFSDKI